MSDRCQHVFQYIKKNVSVIWGDEQKKAFNKLKNYLSNLLILYALIKDEPLFLYLAVSKVAISPVLFKEEQGKQKPIFLC